MTSEMENGFHKDFRGIAKLIGWEDVEDFENCKSPMDELLDSWVQAFEDVTLLDLLNHVQKIGRLDVSTNLMKLLGEWKWSKSRYAFNEGFCSGCASTSGIPPKSSVVTSDKCVKHDDENVITLLDVECLELTNTFMRYDAYILYTDDPHDRDFAFEIKRQMEIEHLFKVGSFLWYLIDDSCESYQTERRNCNKSFP